MQEVQTTLPIGTILRDRYIIEDLLGKGGFGAVYLVRDQRVRHNLFALKELIDSSKLERERFTFEGEVLKRLDHPALPRIYRVFDDDKSGRAYILMDYVDGPNLELLRQQQPEKRFPLSQVLFMMAPVVDAVSYLHRQHPPIIHRDIKPANIIVPKEGGSSVLVDFGIAKEYDPDSTTTAVRRCSPGYGAPEQYSRGTNIRTDIYGLGATIYALLTGPVPADAFYRLTQIGSKGVDPLEPINELVPSLPQSVADAIHKAMAMRSEDRFASVEEFWQALNAYPVNAYAADPGVPPAIGAPVGAPATASLAPAGNLVAAPLPQQARQGSSRRFGIVLLLLATLLIGIGFGAGVLTFLSNQTATHSTGPVVTHRPTVTQPPATPAQPAHHPTPAPTPQPTAIPTPSPTPVPPPPYPNVRGIHNGTAHNTTANLNANMSLSIQQSGGNISGTFTVYSPLQGSGPFSGFVTTQNYIQFVVNSNQVPAPLFFAGTVHADGSMNGTYCSLDATQHCNPNAGGSGTWSVGPAPSPSSSMPWNGASEAYRSPPADTRSSSYQV